MAIIEFPTLQKPYGEVIVDAAMVYWEVDKDFFKPKSTRKYAYRKFILFYLLHYEAQMTHEAIAKMLGGYNRDSVSEGIEKMGFQLKAYPSYTHDMENIKRICGALQYGLTIKADITITSLTPTRQLPPDAKQSL